ncbi:AraC family transcriptional regulator [Clostridium sp. MSJ-11]|uniref:AraC family transcriptional regulator n=1 Tax=Clostridium mobile TaxID=2841512 RepID=A0ABS6EDE8_9CLOT|nr:Ada metal-binding domain-containing protein [Clostridium mobile]MBU5483226.1 AraC family transcriptional regulator [Clostridium mobile]
MKKNNEIVNEEKWNAIINCNRQYDGLFYYAVKTTGIFCRPSCRAKPPLKKNILFFNSSGDAIDAGFRPCKMCRPDINDHIYEPNKMLIQKVKEILDHDYKREISFKDISQEVGMSDSHLTRLFRHYYGLTPSEYIMQARVKRSKELLVQTNLDIVAVAYEVGFKSLSNFYKCFKEQVGYTPKEYRRGNSVNRVDMK